MNGCLRVLEESKYQYWQEINDLTKLSFGLFLTYYDTIPAFRFFNTEAVTSFTIRHIKIINGSKQIISTQSIVYSGFVIVDVNVGITYVNYGQNIADNLTPGCFYDILMTTADVNFVSEPFGVINASGKSPTEGQGVGFMGISDPDVSERFVVS